MTVVDLEGDEWARLFVSNRRAFVVLPDSIVEVDWDGAVVAQTPLPEVFAGQQNNAWVVDFADDTVAVFVENVGLASVVLGE